MRNELRNGDGSFACDRVRVVAQRIEVVIRNQVRICGMRRELLRRLPAASRVDAAVLFVPSH